MVMATSYGCEPSYCADINLVIAERANENAKDTVAKYLNSCVSNLQNRGYDQADLMSHLSLQSEQK